MEFSKPSKPRVWYTRPWSPSASVKPLSHSGCRENRTNKHSYHLKVNFAELGSNTLGRYSTFELVSQNPPPPPTHTQTQTQRKHADY
ncbi:hypothetical protein HanHA89_Chr10g0373341 [Helianthus annuus]|nr:hypothetical protein HanHA89_Chr10g0373341 [Helianthus annuus]